MLEEKIKVKIVQAHTHGDIYKFQNVCINISNININYLN